MENMNEKYCQSCGMPMGENDSLYGSEKDGNKSSDYCSYCFDKGAFTKPDCTMEEMIELCAPHMVEGNPQFTKDEAIKLMREFFPKLKRWK